MVLIALLLAISQEPKAPVREPVPFVGMFVRSDGRTITLGTAVQGRSFEQTFLLDKEAEVLVDGQKVKVDALKAGRPVRLLIRGQAVARVETIKPAEPEKPVAKPEVKPAEVKPARPFPIDETVVAKGEKLPDLGGRILSVFPDGPTTLVTLRQVNEEVPFFLPKDAAVTYVGLEKPDQKPTVGYLVYVWLKPNSKDTAAAVRLARR